MLGKMAFLVTLSLVIFSQLSTAQGGYSLSPDDIAVVQRGYRLYQRGEFAGPYDDGQYTEPDLDTKVLDFWSNGKFARYDRNGDGHHETILEIAHQRLFYIGTIDTYGIFVDVGQKHPELFHLPISVYIRSLAQ